MTVLLNVKPRANIGKECKSFPLRDKQRSGRMSGQNENFEVVVGYSSNDDI